MISPLLAQQLAAAVPGHTILLVDNNNTLLVDSKPINIQGVASPAEYEAFQNLDPGRQSTIVTTLATQAGLIVAGTIVEIPVTLNAFDISPSGVDVQAVEGDAVVDSVAQDLNISGSAVIQAEEAPAEGQPEN